MTTEPDTELPPPLAARLVVQGTLGAGNFGEVLDVEDRKTGARLALKIMPLGAEARRVQRELKAARLIVHPNVIRTFGTGIHEKRGFLLMERATGSLEDLMEDPAHFEHAWRVLTEACRGAAALHRAGYVHRDLKPENILLVDGVGKIADLGLIKGAGLEALTRMGVVLGTPGYLSPEQARGEEVGPKADMFSLAVIAYQIIERQLPYPDEDLGSLMERVATGRLSPFARAPSILTRDALELLKQMLESAPADRPGDLEMAADVLSGGLRGDEAAGARTEVIDIDAAAAATTPGNFIRPPSPGVGGAPMETSHFDPAARDALLASMATGPPGANAGLGGDTRPPPRAHVTTAPEGLPMSPEVAAAAAELEAGTGPIRVTPGPQPIPPGHPAAGVPAPAPAPPPPAPAGKVPVFLALLVGAALGAAGSLTTRPAPPPPPPPPPPAPTLSPEVEALRTDVDRLLDEVLADEKVANRLGANGREKKRRLWKDARNAYARAAAEAGAGRGLPALVARAARVPFDLPLFDRLARLATIEWYLTPSLEGDLLHRPGEVPDFEAALAPGIEVEPLRISKDLWKAIRQEDGRHPPLRTERSLWLYRGVGNPEGAPSPTPPRGAAMRAPDEGNVRPSSWEGVPWPAQNEAGGLKDILSSSTGAANHDTVTEVRLDAEYQPGLPLVLVLEVAGLEATAFPVIDLVQAVDGKPRRTRRLPIRGLHFPPEDTAWAEVTQVRVAPDVLAGGFDHLVLRLLGPQSQFTHRDHVNVGTVFQILQ